MLFTVVVVELGAREVVREDLVVREAVLRVAVRAPLAHADRRVPSRGRVITNCGVPFSAGGVKPADAMPDDAAAQSSRTRKIARRKITPGPRFRLAQRFPFLTEP